MLLPAIDLAGIRGVILDLDGVIYRGSEVLPGAAEFIDLLSASGRRFIALTNHSGRTATAYAEKLAAMGINFPHEKIISSGWATATYLRLHHPAASVFVVGSPALQWELEQQGLKVSERAELVVVGFADALDLSTLQKATQLLLEGARLIATNPDALLPTPEGYIPECGPLVAYLERASGQKAAVIGKPNPWIVELALDRLKLPAKRVLIVGDTVATDIEAGYRAGIQTVLVRTGNFTGNSCAKASAVVNGIHELYLMMKVT